LTLAAAAAASAAPSLSSGLPAAPAARGHCAELSSRQAIVEYSGKPWDLRKTEDLERLRAAIAEKIEPRTSAGEPGASSPRTPDDSERRGLTEMKRLLDRALSAPGEDCAVLVQAGEIAESLTLDSRRPVRRRIDLFEVPFTYYDLMHNPVARGRDVAVNLAPRAESAQDLSLIDPDPSTFWTRPGDIASRDLYAAFGPPLALGEEICDYEGPKKGWGTTPGFNLACGGRRIKAKFGNIESSKRDAEVAVTRLYHALGYHVEPNDYSPEVRVRYDRRILLEFNSRKDLTITITALGFIPIAHIRIQTQEDPFHYIQGALTKSGRILTPEELSRGLIRPVVLERSPRAAKKLPPGTHPGHYREDAGAFEQELDTLIMIEGNIQSRDAADSNVGPWDWNGRDHPSMREVRAAGLVAAWTNYFDARWDNNRLKLVDGDDGPHLRHFISDLGGSLGKAENFIADTQGLLNDFPWTFTVPPVIDAKGRVRKPFRIVRYQPIEDNDAFRDMTPDDARWMARLIGRLTENQIEQALIAGGYTSAEVRLYTLKLVSRRDRMIQDLGLANEIPLLRPRGILRTFDYDPRRDGPVVATSSDGSDLRPIESRDLVVRAGKVEPR